jgi:hypothetical protein
MYACEVFSCKQALLPARAIDILHPKSMELCSQEQKELSFGKEYAYGKNYSEESCLT